VHVHEGGNFHLEIADDGAGIDKDRVKEKRSPRGLISAAQIEKMTANEILNLVFQPGLSDGREGDKRFGARSGNGRGENQHRAHWRTGKNRKRAGPRFDSATGNPADTGDHSGLDDGGRQIRVCDSTSGVGGDLGTDLRSKSKVGIGCRGRDRI